jgi:hypothetical protein
MPISYVVDKDRRLVITTATDRVTFAEFQAYQDQLLIDPDFQPEFNQLVDGTAVTLLDITIQEAKKIAERKVFSSTSRRAFVATSPDTFSITRLAQAYLTTLNPASRIHLFSDLASALKWLVG